MIVWIFFGRTDRSVFSSSGKFRCFTPQVAFVPTFYPWSMYMMFLMIERRETLVSTSLARVDGLKGAQNTNLSPPQDHHSGAWEVIKPII